MLTNRQFKLCASRT